MKFHELDTTKQKQGRRVGRGISSGHGKTSGRGTKGQGARTGSSKKPGFTGGSNPLMQKLPKLPGFKSHKVAPETVYTSQLNQFANKTVDAKVLAEAGLISSAYVSVKVISKGDLTKKVTVKLPKASESAIAAIQSAGGSFEKADRLGRPKATPQSNKTK